MSDQQPRSDAQNPVPPYGQHSPYSDPDAPGQQPQGQPESPAYDPNPYQAQPGQQSQPEQPAQPAAGAYAASQYPTQGQYGQPQYGQNPYPQQAPAPAPYGYGQAQPQWTPQAQPQRGKGLGLTGLIAAIIANIIGVVSGAGFGRAYGQFLITSGIDPTELQTNDPSVMANDPRFAGFAEQVSGLVMGLTAASIIGLIALVISIVAIARKSGRGLGVGGLILALAGPIIVLITLFVVLMPFMQAIA